MKASDQSYLEYKVQAAAEKLEAEGHSVAVADAARPFDLLATRNGKTVAYAFALDNRLRDRLAETGRLRAKAKELGYEFLLAVVPLPREVSVEIAGLQEVLADYLRTHLPAELAALAPDVTIVDVLQLDIAHVAVAQAGIQVAGLGVVEVGLKENGVVDEDDFPLRFDLVLNHDMTIKEAHKLIADTSSVYK